VSRQGTACRAFVGQPAFIKSSFWRDSEKFASLITKRAAFIRKTARFFDAIASKLRFKFLLHLRPAFERFAPRLRRFGFIVSLVCESALGKPNLLIDPEFGFAPFGAQLEGLIHAARCLTDNLTALLAPADSGLDWPGGLSSFFMTPLYSFLKSREQRYSHSSRPWG
jgi:hypothetical protein